MVSDQAASVSEGDRRDSNSRPSLEPQSDVTRYSPSRCIRFSGLLIGSIVVPRYQSQNTKTPEVVFRAMLAENGILKVRLVRAV
jgi:hypothetical protein